MPKQLNFLSGLLPLREFQEILPALDTKMGLKHIRESRLRGIVQTSFSFHRKGDARVVHEKTLHHAVITFLFLRISDRN